MKVGGERVESARRDVGCGRVWMFALVLVGCGDSTTEPEGTNAGGGTSVPATAADSGDGGDANGGGTASPASGGSAESTGGGPTASPASVAIELNVSGASCQVAANTSIVPMQSPLVDAGSLAQISLTSMGDVQCRVESGSTNPFTFEAQASLTLESGAQLLFALADGSATSPNGNDGSGSFELSATRSTGPQFQLRSAASTPCALSVRAITEGGIWGEFDCAMLTDPQTPTGSCAGTGAFVFNNCETGAPAP